MSFETNVGARLSFSKHDVPETDLDFHSRPENYAGSNIFALNKFVKAKKKHEQTEHSDTGQQYDDPMQRLFDRYKDIANDHEENDGGDWTLNTANRDYLQIPAIPCKHPALRGVTNSSAQRSLTSLCAQDYTRRTCNTDTRVEYVRRTVTAPPRRASAEQQEQTTSASADVITFDCTDNMSSADLRSASPTGRVSRIASIRSSIFDDTDTFRSRPHLTGFTYDLARQRFKHAIKIVLILLKWISTLTEKEDSDAERGGKTFTDIATEAFAEGQLKASGIAFDLSHFKAKKEITISKEVKHVLSIPSNHRTAEQLQIVLYGLQHLKSFAEYPLHMQEKLCKVAWYQLVPPKRVIIRQGHYAENFYFLLSGQAVVRILDKNNNGDIQLRTAAVMRKGTSFGELALLHRSRRTATVVSQDAVQLLTIGREDFFDIFMKVSQEDGIPEHIKFTHSIDFMKHFSIDRLLEHPEVCLFHFFKRGVVIVNDSNESDWLYIVKSGSCQVMKQLKGVRPGHENSESERSEGSITKLPRLGGLGPIEGKIDTGLRKDIEKPQIASAVRRAMNQYDHYLTQAYEAAITPKKSTNEEVDGNAHNNDCNNTSMPKSARTPSPAQDKATHGFSKSKYNFLMPNRSRKGPQRRTYGPSTSTSANTNQASHGNHAGHLERSRSLTPGSSQPCQSPVEEDIAFIEPVFVQVDTLKPKDVFGLSTIQFDDDIEYTGTCVSLVSNGAECIMLSKKFFAQHANEKVKHTIRQLVSPYPTDNSLQNNLQTQVDWDQFKRNLLVDTVVHLPIAKARRPTAVPIVRTSIPS